MKCRSNNSLLRSSFALALLAPQRESLLPEPTLLAEGRPFALEAKLLAPSAAIRAIRVAFCATALALVARDWYAAVLASRRGRCGGIAARGGRDERVIRGR